MVIGIIIGIMNGETWFYETEQAKTDTPETVTVTEVVPVPVLLKPIQCSLIRCLFQL